MGLEEIEKKAIRGEDVTPFFSGKPKVMPPLDNLERVSKDIQRVNVDFAQPMLKELDDVANEINVPRQSLIKTMVREALDRYYTASHLRKAK
jgi:hypothetical protein